MKLLLVCLEADVRRLASGYRAVSLARCLSEAGHQITLVTSTPGADADHGTFCRTIRVPYRRPCASGLGSRVERLLRRAVWWPDLERQWVRPVVKRLDAVFDEDRPDAVIVSTPPHVIQLIGSLTARRHGVPYIADLRDDWLTNHRHRWHTPLHKYMAAIHERHMVENATRVVLNTPIVHGRFEQRYPQQRDKFATITNGYDERDFAEPGDVELPSDGRKIIAYTGSMYGGFLAAHFAQFVDQLRRTGLGPQWRLVTAGPDVTIAPDQRDIWTHLGLLEPNQVATLLGKADVLVTCMPPGEETPSGTVPLKIYSYLRSGRPVVYFGEAGSTTDVLAPFSGTFARSRSEWPGFAKWLKTATLENSYDRPGVEQYSFQCLAAQLATIVEDAVSRNNHV